MLSIILLLILAPLIVVATLLWVRRQLINHFSSVYAVRTPAGIDLLQKVAIGGIDQWLHIRGCDQSNPILLFLHGGPGVPQIGWFDAIQRPWENSFTVVQWDQRQTGKSYQPLSKIRNTMTNQQMIQDTAEVIQYLRKRFKQEKIFLIGKSYGSYLGAHMAAKHPEWLHAYVADGQMINFMEFAHQEYKQLLNHAKAEGDKELIDKLNGMAPRPDPNNRWQSFIEHEGFICEQLDRIGKGLSPYSYGSSSRFFKSLLVSKLCSQHLSLKDIYHHLFSLQAPYDPQCGFAEEIMGIDIPSEIGSAFSIPILAISGANDWHVPCSYQTEWFASITAPHKEHIVFENSIHYPYLDEPAQYAQVLTEKLLPLAA